jgi:hypothetical protein
MHPAEELAAQLHDEKYAHDPNETHVVQVWEDGEITIQKCGPLLWQRNLHQYEAPCQYYVAGLQLPVKHGDHSFAFVKSVDDAIKIRALIQVMAPK